MKIMDGNLGKPRQLIHFVSSRPDQFVDSEQLFGLHKFPWMPTGTLVRGMMAPAEFIALAEETGLIVPIGEWVLRQACAEAAAWPDDLKVAVNLSPVQFKKANLPQMVFATLASVGLPAARLELEITESVFLAESKSNLTTLRRLRALGVGISMDDFGTGYLRRADRRWNIRHFDTDRADI
jgi:predicted signal transduction protein with EAL and GGDEF domain